MGKAGLIVLAAAAMAFTHPRVSRRVAFEIRVRTLPEPVDFRSGGRVQDFWTLDVASLYLPAEKDRGATARMRRLMTWFDPPVPRPGWNIID